MQGGGETLDIRRGPIVRTNILDYRPTCACDAPKARPVCLDPFSGIATTGQTAIALGYDYIGCELSEEYAEISKRRLFETPRWKLKQEKRKPARRINPSQGVLFGATA